MATAAPPPRSAARSCGLDGGDADDWSAEIRVEPADSGGARIQLDLADPSGGPGPDQLADEALTNLAREVADNLQAG